MTEPIIFVPGLGLDTSSVPDAMPIKGQLPANHYAFSLKTVYPSTPSVDSLTAYRRLQEILRHCDDLLATRLQLRPARELPRALTSEQATAFLGTMFDPRLDRGDAGIGLLRSDMPGRSELMHIAQARPFPLHRASAWKLEHTLAWADTNMKLEVERVTTACGIDAQDSSWLAEAALIMYSIVMKQQDYWLARHGSLNHSMFVQERVVDLIFGGTLSGGGGISSSGSLSNLIAMDLLRGFTDPSAHTLCVAGISMGVVWAGDPEIQRRYRLAPSAVLGDLDTRLRDIMKEMPVDDSAALESDAMQVGASMAVVLDDNGESVFDVALFQQLMRQNETLTVTLYANAWPVSNNIWEQALLQVLEDDYFADLRGYVRSGRARIIVERQAFRSFELDHLADISLADMLGAKAVYIKGANFFETMQLTNAHRYYAFVAYGDMSVALTGFDPGACVMVQIPAGFDAFEYGGPEDIRTLRQLVESRMEA